MDVLNWSTIPREELKPGLVRQMINTAHMTIARLEMKAGSVVPAHSHYNEQVSMVVSGSLKFLLDDGAVIVRAGEILELKPHVRHGVEVLEDSVAVDLFTPPREDWITGNDAYLRGER